MVDESVGSVIDWDKPIRTVETPHQPSIYDLEIVSKDSYKVRVRLPVGTILRLDPTARVPATHENLQIRHFGLKDGLWRFREAGDTTAIAIENYDESTIDADKFEREEDMVIFLDAGIKIDTSKPMRIAESNDYSAIYGIKLHDEGHDYIMISLDEEHMGPDNKLHKAGFIWTFNPDGSYTDEELIPWKLENYVEIKWDEPWRIAALESVGQPPIEDVSYLRYDNSDDTYEITIDVKHDVSASDTDYDAGARHWFNRDGTHINGEFGARDEYIRIENYVPAEQPTGIDPEKPIRVKATDWQDVITDVTVESFTEEKILVTINVEHRPTKSSQSYGSYTWSFNRDTGVFTGGNDKFIYIENYDPDADSGPTLIDWSKPIRTIETDWQKSLPAKFIGKIEGDDGGEEGDPDFYNVEILELHKVEPTETEPHWKAGEKWYFLENGYHNEDEGDPKQEWLRIENYDPETNESTTQKENTTMAIITADPETKEKPRWDYPTAKKHNMDEDLLLMLLRKLVRRNNVPSWHLSRIKTEGFGAKRFEINLRKPVVALEFNKRKTIPMVDIAKADDEGAFYGKYTKPGKATKSIDIDSYRIQFRKDGLYVGAEEEKQFGLFNEEILLIYELTMESESSLTQLISAVYKDD